MRHGYQAKRFDNPFDNTYPRILIFPKLIALDARNSAQSNNLTSYMYNTSFVNTNTSIFFTFYYHVYMCLACINYRNLQRVLNDIEDNAIIPGTGVSSFVL